MSATDIVRIRIEPELKRDLQAYCARRGTTISQEIRDLLSTELRKQASVLERFDVLMASAEQKSGATGLPEPTMEEINTYIGAVREQRARHLSKAS